MESKTYMVAGQEFELKHYGVKGMRWGHRKAPDLNVQSAKAAYKTARKEYNRAFDKAYNRAIAAWSPIKKHRQANDARWEDAADKAEKLREAKKAYKAAKAKGKASVDRSMSKVGGSTLTDRQIKKYAKKGYAQDSFRSNKTVAGKVWDAYTGAHKIVGSAVYDTSSKKQNRERAERYLAEKQKKSKR